MGIMLKGSSYLGGGGAWGWTRPRVGWGLCLKFIDSGGLDSQEHWVFLSLVQVVVIMESF